MMLLPVVSILSSSSSPSDTAAGAAAESPCARTTYMVSGAVLSNTALAPAPAPPATDASLARDGRLVHNIHHCNFFSY